MSSLELFWSNSPFFLTRSGRFFFITSLNQSSKWNNIHNCLFNFSEGNRCGFYRVDPNKLSPWFLGWQTHSGLLRRRYARYVLTAARSPVLWWIYVFPLLWNGTKMRSNSDWTNPHNPAKMSHACVCGKLWVTLAPMISKFFNLWSIKTTKCIFSIVLDVAFVIRHLKRLAWRL